MRHLRSKHLIQQSEIPNSAIILVRDCFCFCHSKLSIISPSPCWVLGDQWICCRGSMEVYLNTSHGSDYYIPLLLNRWQRGLIFSPVESSFFSTILYCCICDLLSKNPTSFQNSVFEMFTIKIHGVKNTRSKIHQCCHNMIELSIYGAYIHKCPKFMCQIYTNSFKVL